MLAALLAAIGIYLLTDAIGQAFIERVYMSAEAQNQRNLATVSSFQTYAREFNLSSRDTEMISRWAISQDDTYILLYKDRRLALEAGWWGIDEESSGTENLDDLYDVITYPVYLRDGVFQAVVYDFSEAKLYGGVQIGAIALACVMFAIFMLIYNRRITRAIVEISEEVKQIGDGNLQLQLTASGDDELARLTESVESMRKSILKKTDELFRYSLVFGAQELPIQLEPFDAAALLDQMVGEGIVMLEQKGYTIRRAVQPVSCQIQVDASYFKRVLDNLADNICKYADPAKPIHVLVAQESGALTLCVSNTILKNPGQVESNRIGLRICEKIMRQMGGTFEKRQTEDTFTVTLTLPAQPLAVEEGETS